MLRIFFVLTRSTHRALRAFDFYKQLLSLVKHCEYANDQIYETRSAAIIFSYREQHISSAATLAIYIDVWGNKSSLWCALSNDYEDWVERKRGWGARLTPAALRARTPQAHPKP
jgi:hypothetical protein